MDVVPVLLVWGPGARKLERCNHAGVEILAGRDLEPWLDGLRAHRPLGAHAVANVETALRSFVKKREDYEKAHGPSTKVKTTLAIAVVAVLLAIVLVGYLGPWSDPTVLEPGVRGA